RRGFRNDQLLGGVRGGFPDRRHLPYGADRAHHRFHVVFGPLVGGRPGRGGHHRRSGTLHWARGFLDSAAFVDRYARLVAVHPDPVPRRFLFVGRFAGGHRQRSVVSFGQGAAVVYHDRPDAPGRLGRIEIRPRHLDPDCPVGEDDDARHDIYAADLPGPRLSVLPGHFRRIGDQPVGHHPRRCRR